MELARTKKELAEVKMERDILKKSSRVLCQGVAARYAMMKTTAASITPHLSLSRMLVVSASGYYAWVGQARRASERERKCGWSLRSRRPTSGRDRPMARNGYSVTWRSMAFGWALAASSVSGKKLGIRCKQKRRFKATTLSRHRLSVAENVLGQQFKVYRPNAVWVTDITYVPTDEGWLYLAGHKGPVYRRDRGAMPWENG